MEDVWSWKSRGKNAIGRGEYANKGFMKDNGSNKNQAVYVYAARHDIMECNTIIPNEI